MSGEWRQLLLQLWTSHPMPGAVRKIHLGIVAPGLSLRLENMLPRSGPGRRERAGMHRGTEAFKVAMKLLRIRKAKKV